MGTKLWEVPMKILKITSMVLAAILLVASLTCLGCYQQLKNGDGKFAREVSSGEQQLRLRLTGEAKQ